MFFEGLKKKQGCFGSKFNIVIVPATPGVLSRNLHEYGVNQMLKIRHLSLQKLILCVKMLTIHVPSNHASTLIFYLEKMYLETYDLN